MPLFSRHTEEEDAVPVEPQPNEQETKRHGLFGSRKESPPAQQQPQQQANAAPEEERRHHGLFGRRRSTSPTPSGATNNSRMTSSTQQTSPSRTDSNRRSLLQRTFGNGNGVGGRDDVEMDPTIVSARDRVMAAEGAEKDADRALDTARREVREARDQVRKLELEAKEEARRARIKQFHAKEVSKRGKALGREFPPSPALAMTVLVVLVLTSAQQATISRRPPPQSTSPDRTNLLLNRRGRETNLHTLTHTHTRDTTRTHTHTRRVSFRTRHAGKESGLRGNERAMLHIHKFVLLCTVTMMLPICVLKHSH